MNYNDLGYDNLLLKPNQSDVITNANVDFLLSDGAINFNKIDFTKFEENQDLQSKNFESGSTGWQIKGDGTAEFQSATITGAITATSGQIGSTTNYWSIGASGLTAVAGSGDVIINYGKTDFGQDATNGFILGYDYSASKPKFEIGSSASKIFKYDGTDLTLTGGTVTAGTVRTASSGKRVQMSGVSNRMDIYNSSGSNIGWFGGAGDGNFININQPDTGQDYPPIYITSAQESNVINAYCTGSATNRPAFRFESSNNVSVGMYLSYTGASANALAILSTGTNGYSGFYVDITSGDAGAAAFYSNSNSYATLYLSQDGTSYYIATTTSGCYCDKAGTWHDASSVTLKENFEEITVLDKIKDLNIFKYNYIVDGIKSKDDIKEKLIKREKIKKFSKTNESRKCGPENEEYLKQELTTDEIKKIDKEAEEQSKTTINVEPRKYIGPTAEDLKRVFGVGDGKGIAPKDLGGIALQAIKELLERIEKLENNN